jgi:peptide/nickel transport system substrate-binding protein
MALHHSTRARLIGAASALGVATLLLAACSGGGTTGGASGGGDASGEPIIVGTTDKVSTRPARTTTARSPCRRRSSRTS